MMDLLFSILYKQRLKHEVDYTGSLTFRKNDQWQKVSTEVSLCGLRRVTCVDTPCRCISALFHRAWLKYLTNILQIARILCENSPQRSSSKYCLKTPLLTSRCNYGSMKMYIFYQPIEFQFDGLRTLHTHVHKA